MEIPEELKKKIAIENIIIEKIEVIYNEGEVKSGFLKEVKFIPFGITICEIQNYNGEKNNHVVDFDKANKITLIYYNKKTKEYI